MKAALAVGLLALSISAGQAHDAPSGWAYPKECCDGTDCAVVPCGSIEQTGPLQWQHEDATFMANNLRPPRDSQCHVCKWGSIGRCIFFPLPPSS